MGGARITSSIKVHIRDGHMMSTLVYRIQMKRLRTFYTWNFLMPVISLALADLFTFYLPAKSSEKIGLSLFVFLSIGVLTRLFNESMPSTSDNISVFGKLLWINLLISGSSIIVNIVSTTLYYCKSPKCISKCCPKLTKMLKCKICTKRKCCKRCMVDQETFELCNLVSSNERTDQNIPSNQAEWSDVSRNVDIIMGLIFLAVYIVVYWMLISNLLGNDRLT